MKRFQYFLILACFTLMCSCQNDSEAELEQWYLTLSIAQKDNQQIEEYTEELWEQFIAQKKYGYGSINNVSSILGVTYNFRTKLDSLIENLIRTAGPIYTKEQDTLSQAHYMGWPKDGANTALVQKVFFEQAQPYVVELPLLVEKCREYCLQALDSFVAERQFAQKDNKPLHTITLANLTLKAIDGEWVKTHVEGLNVLEAIFVLQNIQTDIILTERQLMEECIFLFAHENADLWAYDVHLWNRPQLGRVGDTLHASICLYDYMLEPPFKITMDGDSLTFREGKAYYRATALTPGWQTFVVEEYFKNWYTGKEMKDWDRFSYLVIEPKTE